MADGAGPYAKIVDDVRQQTRTAGAVLLLFRYTGATGVSVETEISASVRIRRVLPMILRDMANKIEAGE